MQTLADLSCNGVDALIIVGFLIYIGALIGNVLGDSV